LNHTINQKLSIFKGIILFTVLNLAWAFCSYLVSGNFKVHSTAVIYFIGLVPLFALLKWKYKRGLRFLPPFIFLVLAIYYVMTAYGSNQALKNNLTEEMGAMNIFTAFLLLGVVLC
jgi:hypothetical protein